jgi:multidrug resistance efflux pump
MSWKATVPVVALLVAAVLALGFFWPFRDRGRVLRLPGVVEVQEVRLGSKIGGRVAEVAVHEGDMAQPKQLLVRFHVPELEAQRAQQQARVAAVEAELERAINGPRPQEKDAARAAYEAAQARVERLVAGWREEEKEQARQELQTADADLSLALEDFERQNRLYRQNASARADYDAARAARDRARGRVAAARARYDMLMKGSRPEDIKEARAEAARLKANYDLLEAGTREEDKAEIRARLAEARGKLREIEANLAEADVRAPQRAVIEVLAVRPGDLVPPNQPILRVLKADDLWVRAYVPEIELGKLRLHQPVQVTIDAYPGRRFEGTIRQIASESEFTPRNVQSADERRHQVFGIKVVVPQPEDPKERVFKSGLAAEVIVPLHD